VLDLASEQAYRFADGSPWPGLYFHGLDHQDWLFAGPEVGREGFIPEASEWLECGPLRWAHRSLGRLGPYRAALDTRLGGQNGELQVDVRLEGHWQEPPLTGFVSLLGAIRPGGSLVVDTPFAVEPRDPERDVYFDDIPAGRDLGITDMFERLRPGVFWGRSWCDWSGEGQGVTLISAGGCTYWFAEPGVFGHLLLRCVELKHGTWERFCPTSLTGSGTHAFTYAFRFHSGDWRQGGPQRRSLELRFPPVVARAFEPGGCLVRLYEHQGTGGEVRLRFDRTPKAAQAVDLLGQPTGIPVTLDGQEVRLELRRWQIVTLRVHVHRFDEASPRPDP
jgi:hypothetical protein